MSTYIGNNEISGIYVGNSEISSIYVGTDLVYSSGGGDTTNYLCFTSQQDGSTVELKKNGAVANVTLEYSLDKANWNTLTYNSAVTINSGQRMYLRGNNSMMGTSGSAYNGFAISGDVKVSGSIMTLLDKTDELRTIPSQGCFDRLFYGCSGLTDASGLELPATSLNTLCYESLLRECQNLRKAPLILPATTLAQSCYQSMFINDVSLVTAPILPATGFTYSYVYNNMFLGCSSLTTAPTLPATTLFQSCYSGMFSGCASLTSVTSYASNISAVNCLNTWLKGVSASGTFYNYGGATYPSGENGIPSGWTEIRQ